MANTQILEPGKTVMCFVDPLTCTRPEEYVTLIKKVSSEPYTDKLELQEWKVKFENDDVFNRFILTQKQNGNN